MARRRGKLRGLHRRHEEECDGARQQQSVEAVNVVKRFHGAFVKEPSDGPAQFPGAAGADDDKKRCECCGRPEERDSTLICDGCEGSFHVSCTKIRTESGTQLVEWFCAACSGKENANLWAFGEVTARHRGVHRKKKKRTLEDDNNPRSLKRGKPHCSDDEKLKKVADEALEDLRAFISEKQGNVGEGWEVEIKKRKGARVVDKVFCSPEKQKFRSRIEVARFLGLLSIKPKLSSGKDAVSDDEKDPPSVHDASKFKGKSHKKKELQAIPFDQFRAPFPIEGLTIDSLGNVDLRPAYHDETHIWPIGYCCTWHHPDTSSVFTSEIVDGGPAGPIFRVTRKFNETRMDTQEHVSGRSGGYDDLSKGCSLDEDALQLEYLLGDLGDSHLSADSGAERLRGAPLFVGISKQTHNQVEAKDAIGIVSAEGTSAEEAWRSFVSAFAEQCHKLVSSNLGSNFEASSLFSLELTGCKFGLDILLVQACIEALPGAKHCSKYRFLGERGTDLSCTKDVTASENFEVRRSTLPAGTPLGTRMPPELVGDLIEISEFLCRFSGLLKLEVPLLLEDLEGGLLAPLGIDENGYLGGLGTSQYQLLSSAHVPLVDLLLDDFLHKCIGLQNNPSSESVGEKVPVNVITWPEAVRRYIIAFLAWQRAGPMVEINSEEGHQILRCIQGDGGVLCGALSGVRGAEVDSQLLAAAEAKVANLIKDEKIGSESTELEVHWVDALQPVAKLPTNVGSRIRNCIHEALSLGPPEWAKSKLEWSLRKDVYKSNAAGPTKNAVLSVLEQFHKEERRRKEECKRICQPVFIMRYCRFILRHIATTINGQAVSRLLCGTVFSPLSGVSGLLARPLDFRITDLRLGAGCYGNSPDAFAADVRQILRNVLALHPSGKGAMLANSLSELFEELFEEVSMLLGGRTRIDKLGLCIAENNLKGNSADMLEDAHNHLSNEFQLDEEFPKAPWEKDICKVCGIDKDDRSVLLCDACDSEYHIYCLSPQLEKIPEGNWYCPSCAKVRGGAGCVGAAEIVMADKKQALDSSLLAEEEQALLLLANQLKEKEYWELTVTERVLLLKFLCNKAAETSKLREYLESNAGACSELQQNLRSLQAQRHNHQHNPSIGVDSRSKKLEGTHESNEVAEEPLATIDSDINMIETKLLGLGSRRNMLGKDESGRLYWGLFRQNIRPWIVVQESAAPLDAINSVKDGEQWISYETEEDISRILGWLKSTSQQERQIIYALMHYKRLLGSKSANDEGKRSQASAAAKVLDNPVSSVHSRGGTQGLVSLQHCTCLEPLCAGRFHCKGCHETYDSLDAHNKKGLCSLVAGYDSWHRARPSSPLVDGAHSRPPMDLNLMPRVLESNRDRVLRIGCIAAEAPTFTPALHFAPVFDPSLIMVKAVMDDHPMASERTQVNAGAQQDACCEVNAGVVKDDDNACQDLKLGEGAVTGRMLQVLRSLKMMMLDIEAALTSEDLEHSRSFPARRRAWRSLVKSSRSIYEVVEACLVLEHMVKGERLKRRWGLWSSISAAASTRTIPALAFRIYSLEQCIVKDYDDKLSFRATD